LVVSGIAAPWGARGLVKGAASRWGEEAPEAPGELLEAAREAGVKAALALPPVVQGKNSAEGSVYRQVTHSMAARR